MWKLKNIKKEHLEQYVLAGEDCVVGRKDVPFLIADDPSISRRHATLFVKHPDEHLGDPEKKSTLFVRDESSKYGTFVNGERLNKPMALKAGDIVHFGQMQSEYRVHEMPIVVTTSCLSPASKVKMKSIVKQLGGHVVGEWQPICTHLVMDEVKVTVKALCCLVSVKPIVKPEYFSELLKSLQSSSVYLSPERFVPLLGEALIDKDAVFLGMKHERKKLFVGKTFFFVDEKQYKKLHLGIVLGGGSAAILSKAESVQQEGFCLIEPPALCSQTDELKKAADLLQGNNMRMIPESDVGLAVAYCSTEKFCNPKFKMGVALKSQRLYSQTLTQREAYVPDTEESSPNSQQRKKEARSRALSNLNFSSFCGVEQDETVEGTQISQIPLSASVKKELDALFDDDDDDEALPPKPFITQISN